MTVTPRQWKKLIAELGLSQERAGECFGQSPCTGQRWTSEGDDHVEVPLAVEVLAKAMILTDTKTPADLLDWIKARA